MFCDISPTCYKIALQKEIIKRHIKNFLRHERYADTRQSEPLPCLVADCSSHLIKRGKGIDPVLQENKAVNIKLANARMNGILIRPGETFSFWHLVGKTPSARAIGMAAFWCATICCRVSAAGCAIWPIPSTGWCCLAP